MPFALQLLLWLPPALAVVSLAEYVAHRWLMHRPGVAAFWEPHVAHHFRWYRVFDREDDPRGKNLNLRIGRLDTLLACVLALPLAWLVSPALACELGVLAVLHRCAWNAIHPEMHLAEGRWFTRLRVYRALRWWHFLHHRQPGRNFNVTLPLWDYVFGTAAVARAEDVEEWRELEKAA